LVAAWIRVEAASRFEHGPSNLPVNSKRPKPVGEWIAKNRTRAPIIADPVAYAAQWQLWWDSLQPTWRKKGSDEEWSIVDGYGQDGREWGQLYQWGVNGTLTLVASLYFWGCVLGEDPDLRVQWEAAVGDVCWMVEGMA
ncbi:hypothetical protein B0H19DRAFT_880086, partial [Mycena capillaripes]